MDLILLKNYLYLYGVYLTDELFEFFCKSQYSDYRTTQGIFLKLGGTYDSENYNTISDCTNFQDYLKQREYVTAGIHKLSDIDKKYLEEKTHFVLDKDDKNNLVLNGKYIYNNEKHSIQFKDIGFFKLDGDKEELQAGGIRMRNSIMDSNCIGGCNFCDFGHSFKNYITNFLTEDRRKYLIDLIKELCENRNVDTLFITGGNPDIEDMEKWTDFVKSTIEEFHKYSPNGNIDFMITPRGFDKYVYDEEIRYEEYKKYLEHLKLIGANTISSNMELWDEEKLNKWCPKHNKLGTAKSEIGHDGYLDFIKAGIEVFGKFNIRSSLILGLNSIEDVKEAIDTLIPMGCYVGLEPFVIPCNSFSKFNKFQPKIEELIELSEYLDNKLREEFIKLPIEQTKEFKRRISTSFNAHAAHNTANSISWQELDAIERRAMNQGKDNTIIRRVK